MSSQDDYRIPGTEPPEPRQPAEHPSVEGRAKKALIIAVVSVGIAIIAALFGFLQWRAADKQAGIADRALGLAEKQLETTDRPWIKAEPQRWSPITFRDGSLNFNVTFALSNVGRSVATDVTMYFGAFASSPEGQAHFTQPLERQTELCKKVQPAGLRFAIFPDETKELDAGVTIDKKEIEANIIPLPPGMSNPPTPPGNRTAPILFGCVDYRFASLPTHHQTGFIYDIVRREPKTPNVPYLIIVGQGLPADRVNLVRWVFGGDYAN